MASSAELIDTLADSTGITRSTLKNLHSILQQAGLATVGVRGRYGLPKTARDGAVHIIALSTLTRLQDAPGNLNAFAKAKSSNGVTTVDALEEILLRPWDTIDPSLTHAEFRLPTIIANIDGIEFNGSPYIPSDLGERDRRFFTAIRGFEMCGRVSGTVIQSVARIIQRDVSHSLLQALSHNPEMRP